MPTIAPMTTPLDLTGAPSPWLGAATRHYENFPVGSWLLPASVRPAVAALYGFARYADDVADEGQADAATRLAELRRLRRAVDTRGAVAHPAVTPLLPWIERFDLQASLLTDLLSAFEQDVTVTRHPDRAHLLDYCRRSANPIGRLMLQLFGRRDPDCLRWSDAICTALQLINFAQDVAVDWRMGRVYLPQDALVAAGLDDAGIGAAVADGLAPPALRSVIAQEAAHAVRLLDSGRPLTGRVPWRLGLELRLILAGGERIVDRLTRGGFDPIADRPVLRFADGPAILMMMWR